jgi:hypothetical protein
MPFMASTILKRMIEEVHRNKPSTVSPKKKGKALQSQLMAIAYSKARKAGAKV